MKPTSRAAAAALLALSMASPCIAGQVRLEIRNGLVTLSARDASVREVLAEWARVGQTRIVNAERVPSGLVTLELNGVPEARALDILLRSVAGYMAATRPAGMSGVSQYDRVLIMPMARPAPGVPAPPAAASSTPRPYPDPRMRTYQPQPSLMVDDQDEPVQPQPQPQPQPPTQMQMPATSYPGAAQPGVATPGMPNVPGQYTYPQGQQPGMTPQPQPQPNVPGASPTPAAPRPGMTTPPPKPPGNPGGEGG